MVSSFAAPKTTNRVNAQIYSVDIHVPPLIHDPHWAKSYSLMSETTEEKAREHELRCLKPKFNHHNLF